MLQWTRLWGSCTFSHGDFGFGRVARSRALLGIVESGLDRLCRRMRPVYRSLSTLSQLADTFYFLSNATSLHYGLGYMQD